MKTNWFSLLSLAVVLSGALEATALPRLSVDLQNADSETQGSRLFQDGDEFSTATLDDVIYQGTPVKTTDLIANSTVQIEITTAEYSDLKMAICTGTMISSTLVLTAAHCIPATDSTLMNIKYFSKQTNGFQRIKVLRRLVHSKYSLTKKANGGDDAKNDIALLRLAQAVPGVIPATLPVAGRKLPQGQKVIVAGYGLNGHTMTKDELMKDPDVVALLESTKKNPPKTDQEKMALILKLETLAQYRPLLQTTSKASFESDLPTMILTTGQPICQGDSGGPTYLRDSGRLVILGVHSTGTSPENCQNIKSKQVEYGFDTYVPNYIDWIIQSSKQI